MGVFVISKKNNGQYKFVYNSRRGKIIGTSSGFELLSDCEATIDLVRKNFDISTLKINKATNGKFFFEVVVNEQLLFVSRKYPTEFSFRKDMEEYAKSVLIAEILDFSEQELF